MRPKEGSYFASRQNISVALRFKTIEGVLELQMLQDDGFSIVKWEEGDQEHRFDVRGKNRTRYIYSNEGDGILRRGFISKKGKPLEFLFQAQWPEEQQEIIKKFEHKQPGSVESVYSNLKEQGTSIVTGVYDETFLTKLYEQHKPQIQKFNKRGWFSLSHSVDVASDPEDNIIFDQLIGPIEPYINYMLGEGEWVHSGRMQITFADVSRSAAVPTYHIDKMFLKKGEPFSILVGIPLVGELEKETSGNLSVFPGSHLLVQEIITTADQEMINDISIDKNEKLRRAFQFASEENMKPVCSKVLPREVQFSHYRLIHGVEKNLCKQRSIIYLRIKIRKDSAKRKKCPQVKNWIESVQQYSCWALWE